VVDATGSQLIASDARAVLANPQQTVSTATANTGAVSRDCPVFDFDDGQLLAFLEAL
jgi:hypothetical protein